MREEEASERRRSGPRISPGLENDAAVDLPFSLHLPEPPRAPEWPSAADLHLVIFVHFYSSRREGWKALGISSCDEKDGRGLQPSVSVGCGRRSVPPTDTRSEGSDSCSPGCDWPGGATFSPRTAEQTPGLLDVPCLPTRSEPNGGCCSCPLLSPPVPRCSSHLVASPCSHFMPVATLLATPAPPPVFIGRSLPSSQPPCLHRFHLQPGLPARHVPDPREPEPLQAAHYPSALSGPRLISE